MAVSKWIVLGCIINLTSGSLQKPTINASPDTQTAGHNVNLDCVFDDVDINKTYTRTWRVNHTVIVKDNKYSIHGNVLSFIVKIADKYNSYSCTVNDGDSNSVAEIRLTGIRYPPLITLPEMYECDKSKTITLLCEADGNPSGVIFHKWIHSVGNKTVQEKYGLNLGRISKLVVPNCNYQDAGSYQCIVGNLVEYPDKTNVTKASTLLKVRDVPFLNGHTVVNTTIMVTYYSYQPNADLKPTSKLYKDGMELQIDKFQETKLIPFLQYQKLVEVQGYVLVMSVNRSGKYLFAIKNTIGTTTSYVDVWSTNEDQGTDHVRESVSTDCSFMALGFELQVVIVVAIGVVVCTLVLAVALVVIRRCGHQSDDMKNKTEKRNRKTEKRNKNTEKITRVKSVLEDGTVVYDEIDDNSVKFKNDKKGQPKKEALRNNAQHVQEGYEEVAVKTVGQSYDMLHKESRKSKSFFRFRMSKHRKRCDALTSSDQHTTEDNVYTTSADHSSYSQHQVELEPSPILPKRKIAYNANKSDVTATIEGLPKTKHKLLTPAMHPESKKCKKTTKITNENRSNSKENVTENRYDTYDDAHSTTPPSDIKDRPNNKHVGDEYVTMADAKGDADEGSDLPEYINLQLK